MNSEFWIYFVGYQYRIISATIKGRDIICDEEQGGVYIPDSHTSRQKDIYSRTHVVISKLSPSMIHPENIRHMSVEMQCWLCRLLRSVTLPMFCTPSPSPSRYRGQHSHLHHSRYTLWCTLGHCIRGSRSWVGVFVRRCFDTVVRGPYTLRASRFEFQRMHRHLWHRELKPAVQHLCLLHQRVPSVPLLVIIFVSSIWIGTSIQITLFKHSPAQNQLWACSRRLKMRLSYVLLAFAACCCRTSDFQLEECAWQKSEIVDNHGDL